MTEKLAKFIILNLLGATALIIVGLQGWITDLWEWDKTRISLFIILIFLIGLIRSYTALSNKSHWRDVSYISETLVMLGLFGTVVGFMIALSGVDPSISSDPSSVSPMVTTLIAGLRVAIYTTLVGIIGYIWLTLQIHLFK